MDERSIVRNRHRRNRDEEPRAASTYGPSDVTTPFGECTPESRRLLIAVNRTSCPADIGFNADYRQPGCSRVRAAYLFAPPESAAAIGPSTVEIGNANGERIGNDVNQHAMQPLHGGR